MMYKMDDYYVVSVPAEDSEIHLIVDWRRTYIVVQISCHSFETQ